MIRLFTALCKTILENYTDYDLFMTATDCFNYHGEKCPACGAFGKLAPYNSYARNLVSYEYGNIKDYRIRPVRYKCKICGVTHALLPDILIPHSPYSLRFKLIALVAYFERDGTVGAVCEHFGIAVSTLYEWKKRLLSHKELLLGVLLSNKKSAIAFIDGLLSSACLSARLCGFFQNHAFSFLQCPPCTTRNHPP